MAVAFQHAPSVMRAWRLGSIQTTSAIFVRGFVKNVYQEINYSAPFTDSEKEKMLRMINGCDNAEALMSLGLAKIYSKLIAQHMEQNGKFQVLEQLLDVSKMDVQRLEKIGNRVRQRDSLFAFGVILATSFLSHV